MRLIIEVKNPTEELKGHILSSLWSWDISLTLNMTHFLTPSVGVADTSPEGGSNYRLCEEAKRRSNPPGGWFSVRHILFHFGRGIFRFRSI